MPATLDENTQFVDTSGAPLVGGFVHFGVQGADPLVSPITIFSDRELTTPITNPQTLDSLGRATNKVWVPGRYSLLVQDLNSVQIYQELDNGEIPDVGVTALENVAGGDTITATASSTITVYEDLEQYTFRTAAINTAAVTLNIDSVGAKSVVKNHDEAIQPGNFEADQNVIVSFNETDDVFEWVNQNLISVASYKGTDIADSATPTVPTDGDYFEAQGTTTKTSFAIAANRSVVIKSVAGFTLTSGSPIVTESGDDVDIAAGEIFMMQSTAVNVVQITKSSLAATGWDFVSRSTASASATVEFTGLEAGFDYLVELINVAPVTDTVTLSAQVGIAGPTYRTTNYLGSVASVLNEGTSHGTAFSTAFLLSTTANQQGNAANEVLNGVMVLREPETASPTTMYYTGGYLDTAARGESGVSSGRNTASESIDALKFFYSSGNIASGDFVLYKRANL